ncbi:DUF1684 domain-containing protein [Cryobacterium sp. Y11]|uniref:DUF1684 domain-containing protein n=1 Tax=Cryobacterium sp. Y11 TaxID=2045016 RepID=UPI000CE2C4B1|nr:DUF1684 domain-containing protein [Cryobacterium sp. Y11]
MTQLRETTTSFVEDWQRWREERWSDVFAPHGIAALADTVWLDRKEQRVDGVAGTWRADGDTVVGTGLSGSGYTDASGFPVGDTAVLRLGDTVHAGDSLLHIFVRDGIPALRRSDPEARQRTLLQSIDAYEPDLAWVMEAQFTPRAEPLVVELFDGYHTLQQTAGTLEFTLNGQTHHLTATHGADTLAVVFADATNGGQTYRFRFLRIPVPDNTGVTTIDFNRAFLPPCAFSDHYLCPLPSPGNRLAIAVTAGERMPVRGDDAL